MNSRPVGRVLSGGCTVSLSVASLGVQHALHFGPICTELSSLG